MKFDCIQLRQSWSKIAHIQPSRSRPTNLLESTLIEIWLIIPWPKCGHIWLSWLWPKFGRIRQNRPWSKFGRIQSSRFIQIWPSRPQLKFGWVDPSQNLVEFDQVELNKNSVKLDQNSVDPDQKSVESIPYWNLASLVPTKNLSNSMVSVLWTKVLENSI